MCGTPQPPGSSECANCQAASVTRVTADAATPSSLTSTAATGSSGAFQPGQKLGPRYTIIKILGPGGMGAVYQAWDDELGAPVAIKRILAEAFGRGRTAAA